jgi:hypothetical protein
MIDSQSEYSIEAAAADGYLLNKGSGSGLGRADIVAHERVLRLPGKTTGFVAAEAPMST